MNIEILAPAGAKEQLIAAVQSGADAVYLGFGQFNARRRAKNFDFDELCQAVEYCHERGVRVHAALNTLVKENELDAAYDAVKQVALAGVDAVIIQDLAVAKIVRECVPDLEMHASTQLSVHNVAGVKALEKLGFSRVVLARELSEKEIEKICASTKMEVEVFVHGAQCMCLSGGCYLSSILGGRSGNRGLCAQPCRLDFNVNSRPYALSLKDMSLINYLPRLIEKGVSSVKIEGRMKRPEYVAMAVSCCKDVLEGRKPQIEALRKVFSRSGFTDGYFADNRTVEMFGWRNKEDVVAAFDVLKDIANTYKNENPRVKIDVTARIKAEEQVLVTISDGKNVVTVGGDAPEKAINRETTAEDVIKQLSKTGGTPYKINKTDVACEKGLSVPLSSLNKMRREALEKLSALRRQKREYEIFPIEKALTRENVEAPSRKFPEILVRVENPAQAALLPKNIGLVVPANKITKECFEFELVIGEIPSIIFPFDEEKQEAILLEKKQMGLENVLCDNIGAVHLANKLGLNAVGGWGLNLLNSEAVNEYRKLGVKETLISFETSKGNLREISCKKKGIMAYGYLPLMRMRACPAKTKDGCKGCSGVNTLTDRIGKSFTLVCNDKKYTTLLNSVPLFVSRNEINADFYMLHFTLETQKQVKKIFDLFSFGGEIDFERTKGLYFKTLQ